MSQSIYIIENGMRIEIPKGAGLEEIRNLAPAGRENDTIMIEGRDGMLRTLKSGEEVPRGSKIHRIPEISKGASRIDVEVKMLREQIKGRGRGVVYGRKEIDGKKYTAVVVKNFRLNPDKYRDGYTDVLFMLPTEYPALPALGCYMRFPHATRDEEDHHQTLRAHYGAPQLIADGWYWYCVGLGANFASAGYSALSDVHRVWKPAAEPSKGHNLITLYGMADRGINT